MLLHAITQKRRIQINCINANCAHDNGHDQFWLARSIGWIYYTGRPIYFTDYFIDYKYNTKNMYFFTPHVTHIPYCEECSRKYILALNFAKLYFYP